MTGAAHDVRAAVEAALDDFVDRYVAAFPQLEAMFDPDWRSPCEIGAPYPDEQGEQRVRWRPRRRDAAAGEHDLAGLERALEQALHPAVPAYYGRYWSGGLEARAPDGHVSLLLLWNEADAERLVGNLIGHALAKRRARSPFTTFFACTEPDSELFLSVDNATGQVLLEEPGRRRPLRVVAESLPAFLRSLEPAPPPPRPFC
ncbi:MAG TPA: SecY-interacting protein Syd [Pseudomonadales bacterium]